MFFSLSLPLSLKINENILLGEDYLKFFSSSEVDF